MTNGKKWNADPFLLVLLALSLSVNVWLGLEVRKSRRMQPPSSEPKFKLGDTLPPIQASDEQGQPATLRADAALPTVFYVYSHTCGWCARNQPAIKQLAEQAKDRFRFVGLCMGPKEGCARREGDPPFPLYSGVAPKQVAELGLGAVPQTIVISSQGQVTRHVRGAWVREARREVESYFQAQLPELEPTPADAGAH
jgi:peroxiredoxin